MTAHVRTDGDSLRLTYGSEFDLRDGLAEIAHLCGWDVQTEYVVHGWGRPDLLLTAAGSKVAVELKTALTTASAIRKGFQQADIYSRCIPGLTETILCAAEVHHGLAEQYRAPFAGVDLMDADRLIQFLRHWGPGMRERHLIALDRHREQERRLELHRVALAELASSWESPLSAHHPTPDDAPGIASIVDAFFGGAR